MGKRMPISGVIDRGKNWDSIFNALVKMTKNLEKDRRSLEGRIKYLNGAVYKLTMEQKVKSLKGDFLLGLKEKQALVRKRSYENVDEDLDDFYEWFEYLAQKCSNPPSTSNAVITTKDETSLKKTLENEVNKLKGEIEKCQLVKNTEVSALLAEKNFIWNQYNKMESELNEKLRNKDHEVEQANEKLSVLIGRVEELEFSNERLRHDVAKIQSISDKKNNEISRLLKENEELKSRSPLATPLLHPCRADASLVRRKANTSSKGRKYREVKKEVGRSIFSSKQSASHSNGRRASSRISHAEGSRSSSKRKAVEVITIPDDTPKLFTSSFKVPKLKSSSSPHVL